MVLILFLVIPSNTIDQLQGIFPFDSSHILNNDSKEFKAEEYGEPDLNKINIKKEGYSTNDNESLNKLFNIENDN